MKIAFVNYNHLPEHYSPEEWIRRIRPYFGVLEKLAHKHEVYYISSFPFSCEYHYQKVHCHFRTGSNRLRSFLALNSTIQKIGPGIIVVYGLHFPFAVHLLKRLISKDTRIILQSHADKPFTGWRKYFQKHTYRSIDRCFFVSKDLAETFRENEIFSSRQIKEMMPASSFFKPMDRHTSLGRTFVKGDPVFLWVGRLDGNKDPLLVVGAFLEWTKKNPTACLYMIYQTQELMKELNQLLKDYPGWTKNLVLVGKVPHDELVYWYNCADFFISGSHAESFGLSLCEAMSCGTIPIVTDIPSFRKMTNGGVRGISYKAGHKASLLHALDRAILIDREKERSAILNHFEKYISFESIAEKFEEIIEEIS